MLRLKVICHWKPRAHPHKQNLTGSPLAQNYPLYQSKGRIVNGDDGQEIHNTQQHGSKSSKCILRNRAEKLIYIVNKSSHIKISLTISFRTSTEA